MSAVQLFYETCTHLPNPQFHGFTAYSKKWEYGNKKWHQLKISSHQGIKPVPSCNVSGTLPLTFLKMS